MDEDWRLEKKFRDERRTVDEAERTRRHAELIQEIMLRRQAAEEAAEPTTKATTTEAATTADKPEERSVPRPRKVHWNVHWNSGPEHRLFGEKRARAEEADKEVENATIALSDAKKKAKAAHEEVERDPFY